jgi:hypothetical protein
MNEYQMNPAACMARQNWNNTYSEPCGKCPKRKMVVETIRLHGMLLRKREMQLVEPTPEPKKKILIRRNP